jgi:hypothetical protein
MIGRYGRHRGSATGSGETSLVGRQDEAPAVAGGRTHCPVCQREFVRQLVLIGSAFVLSALMLLTSASAVEYAAPTFMAALAAVARLGPLRHCDHDDDKSR